MEKNSKTSVSLKLLIDTKRQKVLFAEADKDFVDFLFTFLSLPVGTVIRLLSEEGMVGSVGNLYRSVENLSETYMQPNVDKDILLKPKASAGPGPNILKLSNNDKPTSPSTVFYKCSNTYCRQPYVTHNSSSSCPSCQCTMSTQASFVGQYTMSTRSTRASFVASHPAGFGFGFPCQPSSGFYMCSSNDNYNSRHPYVTQVPSSKCPSCHYTMSTQATFVGERKTAEVSSSASGEGYVKGVVTYMIMDDLEVKPMSTISSITLLNRFNVKEVASLDEKVVELGMNEGVKLLKESLQSKSVLTNVFLGKKTAG